MKCRHCGVAIRALQDADAGELTWVHTDLGNYLYMYCRFAVATPTETVGEWARKLLDQK